MQYLFVGGTQDGKRLDVSDSKQDDVRLPAACDLENSCEVQFDVYSLLRVRGNVCEFKLYALEGMTSDEVFQLLMDKYKTVDS